MKAVYFEDYQNHCHECTLFNSCPKEGKCACDVYREENNLLDCEGDFYFVEGDEYE